MESLVGAGIIGLAVIVWLVVRPILKEKRREAVAGHAFPEGWAAVLAQNLPVYTKMPADLQKQLREGIMIFLDEKNLVGYDGLEITDEIRVTIAAQACLLLLNRDEDYYPHLHTVNVYPGAYYQKQIVCDENGVSREVISGRLGESWTRGVLVLSWNHSKSGGRNFHDGQNVVIHEFAHQLDQLDGDADGAPMLEGAVDYQSWGDVLRKDYVEFCQKVRRHKKDVMDEYGATNPAEFFAVATETFFEKPVNLHKRHRELFEELQGYYKVDPREWA